MAAEGIKLLIDVLKEEIIKQKKEEQLMGAKKTERKTEQTGKKSIGAEKPVPSDDAKSGAGQVTKDTKDTKICPKCNKEKPLDSEHWYPKPKLKSGWSSWCRECVRKDAKQRYNRTNKVKAKKTESKKSEKNEKAAKAGKAGKTGKTGKAAKVEKIVKSVNVKYVPPAGNPALDDKHVPEMNFGNIDEKAVKPDSARSENTGNTGNTGNTEDAQVLKLSDYMQDGQGRLVHKDNVKQIDKIRDELVNGIIEQAKNLQQQMSSFKARVMDDIEAFVELSAMEYGEKRGGTKGNICLYTYDMKYKVQVQISEYLVFDERLQVAKSMVDECFVNWTQGSRSEVKTIINDAFSVNQEGKINTRRILALRRLDIPDPLWQKAMQAISDSLQVAGSKSYMRVYERSEKQGQWQNITLDMAAL